MKKLFFLLLLAFGVQQAWSQLPEDVLRYSYFPQHGSARNMAIGGAMGSLGGDINALFVNPAGLGMYKTKEVVLSPGFIFAADKANFRGTETKADNKSAFDLGTSGLVWGFGSRYGKTSSEAFSIGVNQTANFNKITTYSGSNDYSSFSEQFAEEASASGLSFDEILNNTQYAYGTAPAVYTYLIDTFRTTDNNLIIRGLPEFLLDEGIALNQFKTVQTKGGIYEIALGYGANVNEKFYWGASIGIPIVSYERNTLFTESDPTADADNNFASFTWQDYLKTTGVGINGKVGIIYKPAPLVRLGLAIHTPSFYSLTDKENSSLTANTEGYNGIATANSSLFNGVPQGETDYTATTPWRFMVSGSYVFRETGDISKQKGFITADIEYITYKTARFNSNDNFITAEDEYYYDDLKSVIKAYYKNAFNFRLGGELKFNTFMVRLGGAYYSSPYKDDQLESHIIQATGGVGYRNHGYFIDLTYVQNFQKDVDFPYRLTDKANTFASYKNNRGTVMLTFGIKI